MKPQVALHRDGPCARQRYGTGLAVLEPPAICCLLPEKLLGYVAVLRSSDDGARSCTGLLFSNGLRRRLRSRNRRRVLSRHATIKRSRWRGRSYATAKDSAYSRLEIGRRRERIQLMICPQHGAATARLSSNQNERMIKMRIKPRDRATWRRWFAWHPVLIDNVTVWLEIIERKRDPDIFDWVYSYRVIDRPGWRKYLSIPWARSRRRLRNDRRA